MIDPEERHGQSALQTHGARHWRDRLRVTETQILVASGLLVGVGGGLGAVAFRYLIEGFSYLFFDVIGPRLTMLAGPAGVVVIPALGGLIFGPLIYVFAREAKGHGVPEVMLAVAQRGGRIRPIVALVKALASALCIGSGGSVGREGPIVQIGSALGSTVGQVFRMPDDRIRTLVACGAAAGIAATFNAPIAGVFFALEVILGEFTTRAFGIVVIASVTSAVIGRTAFGDVPSFPVPSYELVSLGEFALYAVLGIVAGVVGVGFTRLLYWFEDLWDAVPLVEYLKPIPGGLLLGALGLALPQILGVGYPAMSQALDSGYPFALLIVLMLAKMIAVSLTIGSGGSGGVFAPSLFIGSMFGAAFGTLAQALFPGVIAPPGAYGLVGMAAVFSGSARAPITAVIILFELTGDYHIILPLMVAVVLSTLVSEALSADTIYTLKLRRRGIDLRAGRDIDLMRKIPVQVAMTTEVPRASADLTVAEAAEQLDEASSRALLVTAADGSLAGIVTVKDVERTLLDNRPGVTLAEIAHHPVLTAVEDESLSTAIHRMSAHELGQLPVVARADATQVVGMLRRIDVMRAYSHAVLDSLEAQRGRRIPVQQLRGTRLVETTVPGGSALVGQRIADLDLPPNVLVVAIQRAEQIVIPRGSTEIHPADHLTFLAQDDAVSDLHDRLGTPRPSSDGSHRSTAHPVTAR
jgi:CIC family chloride channel protein